jgi:hypothetical protein
MARTGRESSAEGAGRDLQPKEYDEEKETSMKRWEEELLRIINQVSKSDVKD